MQTITLETRIAAPPQRCFLLSLNMDLHMESAAQTNEKAIAGTTHGLIGLGETVTWQGKHFGITFTHETLIDRYESPHYFRDIMVRGAFRRFEHEHFFANREDGKATLMRDVLLIESPLGPLGRLVDAVVLRAHLRRFLVRETCSLNVSRKIRTERGHDI